MNIKVTDLKKRLDKLVSSYLNKDFGTLEFQVTIGDVTRSENNIENFCEKLSNSTSDFVATVRLSKDNITNNTFTSETVGADIIPRFNKSKKLLGYDYKVY